MLRERARGGGKFEYRMPGGGRLIKQASTWPAEPARKLYLCICYAREIGRELFRESISDSGLLGDPWRASTAGKYVQIICKIIKNIIFF